MKQKRIVKLLIYFSNGYERLISIVVKSEKDLEKFKNLKFTNVIKMSEIK
jgi:hypothetical protein